MTIAKHSVGKKKSPIVIKINKFFRRLLTAMKKIAEHPRKGTPIHKEEKKNP